MSIEHRQFRRILSQRFGGCALRFDAPTLVDAMLADISVGGMKVILDTPPAEADVRTGTPVRGEIHNTNPAFSLPFVGTVAWSRQSGEAGTVLGLQFSDYTILPDALMNLVERFDDG